MHSVFCAILESENEYVPGDCLWLFPFVLCQYINRWQKSCRIPFSAHFVVSCQGNRRITVKSVDCLTLNQELTVQWSQVEPSWTLCHVSPEKETKMICYTTAIQMACQRRFWWIRSSRKITLPIFGSHCKAIMQILENTTRTRLAGAWGRCSLVVNKIDVRKSALS